jgi:hypothetical protein
VTSPAPAPGRATWATAAAAQITGPLWAAITAGGGLAATGWACYPGAYDLCWLASLPLPAGPRQPPGQPAALLDRRDTFERHDQPVALAAAYAARPRSIVYEDIGHADPDAWHALAATMLGRLSATPVTVACSAFASRHGDESLPGHWDAWYGAIIHISGTKDWAIGPGVLDPAAPPPDHVTTRAGDILLLPRGLPHAVTTPRRPGHSLHLNFALHRDPAPPDSAALPSTT